MENNYFFYYAEDDTTLDSIAQKFLKDMSGSDLLNFEDNKGYIFSQYNDEDKKQHSEASASLVKKGTPIQIPVKGSTKFPKVTIKKADVLSYENLDKVYFPEDVSKFLKGSFDKQEYSSDGKEESYIRSIPRAYILIYSRSLDKLVEVTDFYMQGFFGNESKGGNFSFELLPIEGFWDNKQKIWVRSLENIFQLTKNNDKSVNSFYEKSNFYKKDGTRIDLYFEKIFNPQDLVFIKTDSDFIDKENINPDSTQDSYEMIGLIDNITPALRIDNNVVQVSLSISGKDLSKILNTDQTHFFPIEFFGGEESLVGNYSQLKDKSLADRIFGKLNDLDFGQGQTIEKLFTLIVDKLTSVSLGIENSNCFTVKKGIWDFIKIELDPKTATRELFDSSISTMSGSVMNFFSKLVREPFAEIVMDTYGSKYRIFVRNPPLTEQLYYNNEKLTISDKYIIAETLTQDDFDMYAWFRMVADSSILGNSDLGLVFLPAILIEKFAKIFGSRSLQYSSNYLYYSGIENSSDLKKSNTIKQSAEDLKYMIQAFASNVFLKKGTISLQNVSGIKRGTNLYVKETDMLFYVDSYKYVITQNDFQVDVNVSRGIPLSMVSKFFNLIDITVEDDKVTKVSLNEDYFKQLLTKNYG